MCDRYQSRGKTVNMIRYADDNAVVSHKGLHELMNRLNAVTKEYDMNINVKKSMVLCTLCLKKRH